MSIRWKPVSQSEALSKEKLLQVCNGHINRSLGAQAFCITLQEFSTWLQLCMDDDLREMLFMKRFFKYRNKEIQVEFFNSKQNQRIPVQQKRIPSQNRRIGGFQLNRRIFKVTKREFQDT